MTYRLGQRSDIIHRHYTVKVVQLGDIVTFSVVLHTASSSTFHFRWQILYK